MVNLQTIIDACDDDELNTVLEAIYLKNKRLFGIFIGAHPDLIEPPVEGDEKPETPEISEEELEELKTLALDLIVSKDENELGASLEEIIADLMDLGYARENIDMALEDLLDKAEIYEPFTGKLKKV